MTDSTTSSNGGSRYQSDKVRVAIIGVGNCASSLVQGVEYYKDADPTGSVPGLMHVDLGGYHVSDIEFTAAFDIDSDKVGKDLSEAIWAGQNNTIKFADVPNLGVPVHRGMTHDGLGKYLKEKIQKAPGETDDIGAGLLEDPDDVIGLAGRLLDDLADVLAEPVVGHAARDADSALGDVGELDRVVGVRPDRVGEVLADLRRRDVERGSELDVPDVVAAEVDVHEARDELVGLGVAVVLDALQQRVRAVAHADDRDADLAVA